MTCNLCLAEKDTLKVLIIMGMRVPCCQSCIFAVDERRFQESRRKNMAA